MKTFVTVMIAATGLLLAGCGSHSLPQEPANGELGVDLNGFWLGTSYARWSGPVDEELTAEDTISFYFDSASFDYIEGRPDVDWIPIPGPQVGSGTFGASRGLIDLALEYSNTTYVPYYLTGRFAITWDGEELTLTQVIGGTFPTYHRIALTRFEF